MAVYLFLGGISSGKSAAAERYAQKLADNAAGTLPLHICVYGDESCGDTEFIEKIRQHQARRSEQFVTHSCFQDPLHSLQKIPDESVLLIDDLGSAYSSCIGSDTFDSTKLWENFLAALLSRKGDTVIVSPEVGLSLVSPYQVGREFQEELGRANQVLAQQAAEVYLVIASKLLPLR